ncbi:uncharacterized protein LOC143265743 isoform X1 [Megachile rotundata]|uniref:uncharacterized protein LOC143265743 isoform X1 n=2 Tax=Megachile rotundata TaxID=143995 RepID=UPI003FD5156C
MKDTKISRQQVSSCHKNIKFISNSYTSKEEFGREYRKLNYDKAQTIELFLQIFAKLEKAVSEGSVDDFKNLRCLIKYASQMKDELNLKDYYNNPDNPIRNTNLVILACKQNKQEILKYLFDNDSKILNNLFVSNNRNIILPDDEDDECHNAFYYAIRSSNIELLDTLINIWPGNYFNFHSDELDTILSKAYEELKLKYVSLSDKMESFIIDKLINLRFFSNISTQKKSCRCDLNAIKKRIELVLKNINLLKAEYSNTEKVDDKFLFLTKFIAQNIHILKQQLKSTYDRLPWEEIEFYLVSFVSAYTKRQEINLFYFSTLNKKKILSQLNNFGKKLEEEKANIETMDSTKISDLPKLKRDIVISRIIKNNPEFEELYNDYQQIRDIYSLEKLNYYIQLALSTNCSEKQGQLIIVRVLQVIGEYLKNTLESPKLSNTTSELFLLSLPKHTREVVKDLRNSLSHAYSLCTRTEIEKNTDVNFFSDIQNDIKKVGDVVTDILYSNRMKALRIILEKFVGCKTFDEMKEIIEALNNLELNNMSSKHLKMKELVKLEKFVEELNNIVTDKTDYEKELFSKINNIISSTEDKSINTKTDYIQVFATLNAICMTYNDNNINHNTYRTLKFSATKLLEMTGSKIKHLSIEEIAILSMKILQSVKSRIPNSDQDEINRLTCQIFHIVEFQAGNIKSIEKLREKLSKKNPFMPIKEQKKAYSITKKEYNNQLALKLSELKIILNNNDLNGQLIEKSFLHKKKEELLTAIKMLMLDIMSILGSLENYLENNLFSLDDNTPLLIGKCLRNHLAHDNALVDILLFDPSLAVILNAKKLTTENIIKNSRKIGKFMKDDPLKLEDKLNKSLAIITNQEKMFVALEEGKLEDLKDCLKKGADLNARHSNLWTTLHFAAKGPSLEVIKFILNHNLSVNVKNIDGQSPLHIAAAYNRRDIVQFFVKNRDLCIDDKDCNGKTPLHIAAQNGNTDIVNILLKNSADHNIKDVVGFSPLHSAVKNNHINVVQILMKKEVDADDNEVKGGFTSLHIAAENGHLETVNFLLKNGANVNAKNDREGTSLLLAAINGHLEVVNTLILNNADLNVRAVDGYTALLSASEHGHEEIVNILLKYGANANVSAKTYNCTPLHLAAKDGYDGIVKILLKNKANINIASIEGMTALHFAVQNNRLEVVTTLLEHGANSNAKNIDKTTPLHYAAANGHKEIVDLLIKSGAEVNSKGGRNLTPLHAATMNCHTDVVDLLIKHKAEINGQDIEGNIPLHIAVMKNNQDIIDLLIKNKADVNAKNIYGLTPLHTATANCSTDIIDLLIRNKAKVNVTSHDNFTPLLAATISGSVDAISFLIKNGAEVNTVNKFGITLLQVAVVGGHKDAVNALIRNKADVNAFGTGGTALHLAARNGNNQLVQILIKNGANVNVDSRNMKTPLAAAVESNCKEVVETLISNGANVDAANGAALSSAVFFGHKDIIKVLLDNNANIHLSHVKDTTLLHLTATRGETEIVNVLIEKGANINATNNDGITPLHCAVSAGYRDTVELLLLKGANVNANSTEGTPLHSAVAKDGGIDIVKILLNNGADVSIKDLKNRTALELAVAHNQPECVKLLLSKSEKRDINAKGNDNWTVLHIAVQRGDLEMIKCLIEEGSDVNARNTAGSKPIHIAARDGFRYVVEFFLSNGCSIHELGVANQTLLHYAALGNQLEVVKYLISKGADINAQDNNGLSPTHIAALHGHESIIEVLLQNGAIYNIVNLFDVKPVGLAKNTKIVAKLVSTEKLFDAVKRNNTSEVEKCIKVGACINAKHAATKGYNGTALHYAAWKGYDEIVNILLQNKANPNMTGDKGFTPLHYAVKFSHLKVVMVLLSKGTIYNAVSDDGKTPLDFAADKNIIKLLKLVSELFKNVTTNNPRIINELNKIKDINMMKAIMGACNKERQSLIVTAMINKFSKVKELKEVLQEDVSSQIDASTVLAGHENFQLSLNILQRVLEKRKEIFGPDNPATLDIQKKIAVIIYKQGIWEKAANMSDKIFQKQKEMFGFDSEDTLDTRSLYALILHRQGKDKEALDIFEEVYKKQKQILGPNHPDILNTELHMALVLCALEKYEKALELNKIVFEKRKKLSGENDSDTIRAQNNIAMVLMSQGKYDEALKIYQLVFEKKKMIFGINHSDTIRTLQHIASIYHSQKRYKEALRTTQEVLDLQKSLFGENYPDTLHSQYNLATMFVDQGKCINALKICNECVDKARVILGPSHSIVLGLESMIKFINLRYKWEGSDASKIIGYFQREINTAASNGDMQIVRKMLKDGIDINDHDFEGRAPLHFAVSNGHVDIVNLLLENGADVSQVTKKGNTSLHIAASKNYKEIVEILLQHISRDKLLKYVNAKTTGSGATSLHIAAINGSLDIVKSLLTHGATYNIKNNNGETPFDLSYDPNVNYLFTLIDKLFRDTKNGHVDVINVLEILKHDDFLAAVNARDIQGSTLLQVAVSNKHKTIASKLLKMIQQKN